MADDFNLTELLGGLTPEQHEAWRVRSQEALRQVADEVRAGQMAPDTRAIDAELEQLRQRPAYDAAARVRIHELLAQRRAMLPQVAPGSRDQYGKLIR